MGAHCRKGEWTHNEIRWRTSIGRAKGGSDEISRRYNDFGVSNERGKTENGFIEEAGKTVIEYVCTFVSQIEAGIKESLPLDSNPQLWVVRWVQSVIPGMPSEKTAERLTDGSEEGLAKR